MLAAPAKLNFGLRITGRRADGYHTLASCFVPLGLADALTLRAARELAIAVEGPEAAGVPADASNLALRAARAFFEAAGLERGVAIRLTKNVPAAAGLGGGSSDAAAVLRALAARHPGRLAPARLAALALELGADVPWFLDPQPAWVRGVGERIEPLAGIRAFPVLLALPEERLATAAVYAAWDADPALTPSEAEPTLDELDALRGKAAPSSSDDPPERACALRNLLHNDLEPAATRLLPVLSELRAALAASGAEAVGMTGSGPTMYGVFSNTERACRAEARLGGRFRTWVTATVASTRATGPSGAWPNW